jgi:hypothetical protein
VPPKLFRCCDWAGIGEAGGWKAHVPGTNQIPRLAQLAYACARYVDVGCRRRRRHSHIQIANFMLGTWGGGGELRSH